MNRILAAWAESQIYCPREVFGYRLKPFSIGHFLILTYSNSPFIFGGKEIKIDDLFLAISVCSRSYQKGLDLLFREDWQAEAQKFTQSLVQSKASLEEGSQFFKDYMSEAMEAPEVVHDNSLDQSQAGAPWIHAMKITLMQKLGLTEDQMMNRWIKKAHYEWISLIECQDPKKYRLKNEDDYDVDELPKKSTEEVKEIFDQLNKKEEIADAKE